MRVRVSTDAYVHIEEEVEINLEDLMEPEVLSRLLSNLDDLEWRLSRGRKIDSTLITNVRDDIDRILESMHLLQKGSRNLAGGPIMTLPSHN